LARAHRVAVRFADLGGWSEGELRAEYDPTVPEIRINLRIAETIPREELGRFVALAVGHELYHHRERIGEVPMLKKRGEREAAADAYARALLSETDAPDGRRVF
jgi:hypothetical protein